MRNLFSTCAFGAALVLTAVPANAGGLTSGRIEDSRADVVKAASDAQDVANSASYADRIVVLGPPSVVDIPVEPLGFADFAPQVAPLALETTDSQLVALFIFGGLVGLPAVLGGGGGFTSPPTGGSPGIPSGPEENPPPPPPPPAVPEPATWAMLLLGFGAIGAGIRRNRAAGSRRPGTLGTAAIA